MPSRRKSPSRPPQRDVDVAARIAAAAENSLKIFYREAWPLIVPGEPFQDNWHIDAICDHLEALARHDFWNLLINMPPRFGKSNICSVAFPAWRWIRDPSLRIISASYAQALSTRDSRAMRLVIASRWYQERWGDRFKMARDQDEKIRFENDKRGYRIATSVGGMATGEGADLQIADDPHNTREAESELERAAVRDWWNVVMPTRTGRAGRAERLVVMQRLNEDDLSGDILQKGGEYVHLNLPMEYESGASKRGWAGWSDPRKIDGELMWPQRFSNEVITASLRPPHMSAHAYAGQFQQRPAPLEGGMFKRQFWKYYKVVPDVAKANDSCWSWDMAFKDLKDSDFVCGTAWLRFGGDYYLLPHCVHERIGFSASLMAVKSCRARYPGIRKILVEDKANGTAVIESLKHEIPGIIAVEPEGGKESRAWRVQPIQEAGNIYLPDPSIASWVEKFIEEHRVFPNGANDDFVDSTSQAINRMENDAGRGFYIPAKGISFRPQKQEGERYRDPRYGDETVVVGYSERGDMKRSFVSHRRV